MSPKSDYPALRMRIERGHLVPAGPFDAERLMSYRNGAIVMCRFTEERDRVLIKRWFAIIGLVLKQCDTPWKNKDEAHEALKLALGIVNLSKTVGGDYMQYPRSLSELDDPEMTEALQNMTELLSRMTGVDVETLRKETAHIVDHDEQTGEIIEHETTEPGSSPHREPVTDEATPPASSAEGVDPSLSTPSTLADASVSEARPDDAEAEAADATAPNASAASNLSSDQRAKLIEAAGKFMKLAQEQISFESRLAFLESREADWRDVIEPENWPKLESLATAARAVINSKRTPAQAIEFMASVLECSTSAIGG